MSVSRLSRRQKIEYIQLLEERDRRKSQRKIDTYYPDTGPLRRDLYTKHLETFRVGAKYRERCLIAANRIGKTESVGAYETALHLTGQYPDWWQGRRFDRPISAWAAGKTNETTRDIVQAKLIGTTEKRGTGLIPGAALGKITPRQGVPDAVDTIRVEHVSGGWSTLGLKSYQQGRGSFEGTEKHWIWLDEEPPASIYGECLIRTATTNGLILLTFTPLEGLSEVVLSFMPGAGFDA